MDFVKREPGLAAQDTGRTTTANRCRDRWGPGLGASFFSCRPSRGSPQTWATWDNDERHRTNHRTNNQVRCEEAKGCNHFANEGFHELPNFKGMSTLNFFLSPQRTRRSGYQASHANLCRRCCPCRPQVDWEDYNYPPLLQIIHFSIDDIEVGLLFSFVVAFSPWKHVS